MSGKIIEFKRKNNYQDEVIDWIKCKRQSHSEILFIPNENCIKGYYKGLVLFEKITDRCQNLVQRCSKMSLDEAVNELGHGMPRDRERRTQQIIALNNMTFDNSRYSVCGFETTVSQNDVKIPGKKGNPEMDLVVINPSKKKMLLIEYKCKGPSMLKGRQNIKCNYIDYKKILDSDAICTIKSEMLKSYKLLCRIRGKNIKDEDFNPDDYEVQIAFLFVDRVLDKYGNIESEITFDDYIDAMKIFKQLQPDELEKVLYIRCETADEVILDNWKPIANSGLKKTIAGRE